VKRLIALLLCLLLLTACGSTVPVEEAPVSDVVAPKAPAEGPTEQEVIDLLRKAEAIYQPGNFEILTAVSQENFIDGSYYDEVGGYEEAVAEIFTQNGAEQLEETVFLEIPLICKEDGRVYRQSAMTDSAALTCYAIIDGVALVAEDSGNYFYEITHTPLPKGYTAEEKHKLSALVSPLTIVWEDGRWKVDFFAAFGQDAIACGTPLAPEETDFVEAPEADEDCEIRQLPGHIAVVPEPTALTEEEIAQVNAAFEPIIENKVNPLGLFLMCWYSSPAEFDLTEFLRYFPDSQTVTDSAEFEALKAHQNWSWPKDATLDRMPVPIHRIPAEKVQNLLSKYMGVSIEDVTYHPSSDLIYLEEYDCYYNFTSDAGFGSFTCIGGDITGGTLTLRGTDSILTLWLADDSWMIHSFMPDFSSHYSSEEK